jgi:predicted phosphodiesterase
MKKIIRIFFIFFIFGLAFSQTLYMKIGEKLVIKGLSENFSFSFPNTADDFIVAIYGDSRWGNEIHKKIVEEISNLNPDVVVHLGDMVNKGNNLNEWNLFFEITLPLRQKAFFQVVKGNHEYPDDYFKKFFGVENYYSDFLDFRFIYLDLNTGLESVEKYLTENVTEKTIVFLHYPIFNVGAHCSSTFEGLHQIFKSLGIKLVFSAHDHNYQRFLVEGVNYVITGGGGAYLYSKKCESDYLIKFYKSYNFVILTIENNIVYVKSFDINKKILDSFEVVF